MPRRRYYDDDYYDQHPRHPRRRRSYDDDYYYWHPRRRNFGCLKGFLYSAGILAVILVCGGLIVALAPFFSFLALVFTILIVLGLIGGVMWLSIFLYGYSQEQLQKRDDRDLVRLAKQEQVLLRNRKTGHLKRLEEPAHAPVREMLPYEDYAPAQIAQSSSFIPDQEASPSSGIVYFANIRGSLRPGQVLLGVQQDRTLRIGVWDDLKTVIVLGMMGAGKTNDMAELTAEAAQGGALLVVCDPHYVKKDSLYHLVAPLAGFLLPGTTMGITHEEIAQNVRQVGDELERRVHGGTYTHAIVLVIDEVNRLVDDEEISQDLLAILSKVGREGRGYGVYAILGLQEVTYLAKLRKKCVAAIVHRVALEESERVLPARFAKLSPELPNGFVFVKDAWGGVELLQRPLITSRDIQLIASEQVRPASARSTRQLPPRTTRNFAKTPPPNGRAFRVVDSFPNELNVPKQRLAPRSPRLLPAPQTSQTAQTPPKKKKLNIPYGLRQQIVALRIDGVSKRKIKDLLGLHGEKYQIIQIVCEEENI